MEKKINFGFSFYISQTAKGIIFYCWLMPSLTAVNPSPMNPINNFIIVRNFNGIKLIPQTLCPKGGSRYFLLSSAANSNLSPVKPRNTHTMPFRSIGFQEKAIYLPHFQCQRWQGLHLYPNIYVCIRGSNLNLISCQYLLIGRESAGKGWNISHFLCSSATQFIYNPRTPGMYY